MFRIKIRSKRSVLKQVISGLIMSIPISIIGSFVGLFLFAISTAFYNFVTRTENFLLFFFGLAKVAFFGILLLFALLIIASIISSVWEWSQKKEKEY
ncbi:MAG: hypothetical protein DRH06_00365 [Deltaproteobacteria bacterium]|nr:MAG: hypothetical protein DRH06_00365 [Deltaproteobacteria bacterium]